MNKPDNPKKPSATKRILLHSLRAPTGPGIAVSIVIAVGVIVVGAYVLNFAFEPTAILSKDPGRWGVFGDYVGGLLNPVVALAALGLLAYSIRIQRHELNAAQKAMAAQAQHAEDMVWLSAMVAVIEYQERRMQTLSTEEKSFKSDAESGYNTGIVQLRQRLLDDISKAEKRRDTLLAKIDQMVEQTAIQELRRTVRRHGI